MGGPRGAGGGGGRAVRTASECWRFVLVRGEGRTWAEGVGGGGGDDAGGGD